MESIDAKFATRVTALVMHIPRGKVMTYGQIAAMCGNPRAARIVGGVAHFGDPAVPWQRVVNKNGGLAAGYPGGRQAHKAALEVEGVAVDGATMRVKLEDVLWCP